MLPPPTATSEAPQLVTVEEAIESFRKNIIRKEMEIAGIIESDHPFYRHFRLEYGDNIVIHIRCTYEANYAEQALTISCY
jgi:capsule polysaccharide export protein KpsE/RkpR